MKNSLFTGDNLFVLNGLDSNSVDLIYLDPPFNSKRVYAAPVGSKAAGLSFSDMWTWRDVNESYLEKLAEMYPALLDLIQSIGQIHSKSMMAYITYMTQRVIEMQRILKDSGSIYLHCDPTASHYIKIILDQTFGSENFMNEIIWYYKNASRGKRQWAKSHDTILLYAKDREKFFFNREEVLTPFESGMTEWRYKRGGQQGKPMPKGKTPDDVITIPSLNAMAKERTGYPTQKPLALLTQIIKAASRKDDVVLDPFCGCATTCVAAQQLQRKWIGIDIEKNAATILVERLSEDAKMFKDFAHRMDIPKRTDLVYEAPSQSIKEKLFGEQAGECKGCRIKFNILNFEIDHIVPKSKGGGDYYENYQLLCGSCNRIKGNRPMEYLRMKISKRRESMANYTTFGS